MYAAIADEDANDGPSDADGGWRPRIATRTMALTSMNISTGEAVLLAMRALGCVVLLVTLSGCETLVESSARIFSEEQSCPAKRIVIIRA